MNLNSSNTITKVRNILLSVGLGLFSTSSMSEQIFQWTDESGVTHYSDKQPFGTEAKAINVRTAKAKSASPENNESDLYNRARKLEQKQADEKIRAEVAKEEAEFEQARSTMCDQVTDNLNKMASSGRVKVLENGEYRYLAPEEIEERRAEYQSLKDKHCKPS